MKRLFKYYYIFLELVLFAFLYMENNDYYFKGILYHLSMILLILVSIFIVCKFNNTLKFKNIFYLTISFYELFLNNIYLSILLIILFFMIFILNYKNVIFKITFGFVIGVCIICFPITLLLCFFKMDSINGDGSRLRNMIYSDYHYKCGKYEIFWYSGGAMDSFHYAVIEPNSVIKIGDLIDIGYDKQIGDTLEEYNKMLYNNNCKKVSK